MNKRLGGFNEKILTLLASRFHMDGHDFLCQFPAV